MIARSAPSRSSPAPSARRYAALGLDRSARPSKRGNHAANAYLTMLARTEDKRSSDSVRQVEYWFPQLTSLLASDAGYCLPDWTFVVPARLTRFRWISSFETSPAWLRSIPVLTAPSSRPVPMISPMRVAPVRTVVAAVIAPAGTAIVDFGTDRRTGCSPAAAPISALPHDRASRFNKDHGRGLRNNGNRRRRNGRRRGLSRGRHRLRGRIQ